MATITQNILLHIVRLQNLYGKIKRKSLVSIHTIQENEAFLSHQTLESLLLPGHVRLRSQLDEVLDLELIRQQVDHGALDLHRLAGFIINTMASLCAPVRDPEIRAVRDLKDPVELLR